MLEAAKQRGGDPPAIRAGYIRVHTAFAGNLQNPKKVPENRGNAVFQVLFLNCTLQNGHR